MMYGDVAPHDETCQKQYDGPTEFGGVLADFCQAIEAGEPPIVSGMDGVLAVESDRGGGACCQGESFCGPATRTARPLDASFLPPTPDPSGVRGFMSAA